MLDPSSSSTLYAATSTNAVFRTTNGAASWASARSGFTLRTAGVSCSTLAPGLPPLTPSRLAAAGSRLYLATEGRGVWTESGVDAIVFGDGFESGTTAAWSATIGAP